jgi:hypothetical protein
MPKTSEIVVLDKKRPYIISLSFFLILKHFAKNFLSKLKINYYFSKTIFRMGKNLPGARKFRHNLETNILSLYI